MALSSVLLVEHSPPAHLLLFFFVNKEESICLQKNPYAYFRIGKVKLRLYLLLRV